MTFSPITPDWAAVGKYWFDLIHEYPRDEIYCALVMPSRGTSMSDDGAMFLAWAVALRGAGHVSPNPLVGAVIVDRNGGFLSAGAHLRVGGSHAEISALKRVENVEDFTDASLFVTLEPCAHEGRTPSCAALLAKTKVARVVYGMRDPNPLVNGQGADILLKAGKITRRLDHWEPYCRWLCRVFTRNFERGDIFVAMKVASTKGGVIGSGQSSRMWITDDRAREAGHFLRMEYDAILCGPRTVMLDNPTLNVRHSQCKGRTPVRVVLDPTGGILRKAAELNIFKVEPDRAVIIVGAGSGVSAEGLPDGARAITLPLGGTGQFSWNDIKLKLWEIGVRSLLIEGGAGVYTSALAAGVVDVIHWFVAPEGPEDGIKWAIPQSLSNISKSGGRKRVGVDTLIEWSPATGEECP
jgi:diaminohydroxyphosphoribosylaminopyrimidine deaminase/5-amino-6-(5-phosphoribosylamino)uracil reductase